MVTTVSSYEIAFAGASPFALAAAAFVDKGVVESYPWATVIESPMVAWVSDD